MNHPRLSILALALFLLAPALALAEPPLSYYLPEGVTYDPAVPEPRAVLGFDVGEWHVRHDQLVHYMERLAETSERVQIEVIGHTYERRPLVHLTISSPENLARLDELRAEHARLSDPEAPRPDTSAMPIVVNLGYSVHGNEASGSNASLVSAYHLAAAQGEAIDQLLAQAVIILDPSLNPDGLARFAGWVNMHRGRVLVDDPFHREHQEVWPRGRTNHYWFDLNRDWLPARHPESRARLRRFHLWRPNVLTDFHEMGTAATYFFQPGVPSRQNPLTPAKSLELTREIAAFHARALDGIGSLYYSEERFDDFYYGKGSTYPDLQGSIGILFEQASARGHLQESPHGPLSFPFAVRNHVTTTFSTLEAALAKRRELLDYQADFFREAVAEAAEAEVAGYVFGDPHGPVRTFLLVELLRLHGIEVHTLAQPLELDGDRFEPEWAYLAPASQPQARLLRALFERRVDFADNTFYDVSTWTLPLAFDIPHRELDRKALRGELLGEPVAEAMFPARTFQAAPGDVAYLFESGGTYAPRAIQRLLAAEVRVQVASRPFHAATRAGQTAFGYGTIAVPLGIQTLEPGEIAELFSEIARDDGIEVHAATSGLTPEGIDLGSPSFRPLEAPKPAIVVGRGVDSYEAGEAWHLLDQRFGIPVALLESTSLDRVELAEYTHLVLVGGRYGHLDGEVTETLDRWVRGGGVLVALKQATEWVDQNLLRPPKNGDRAGADRPPAAGDAGDDEPPERRPYADRQDDRAVDLISGAIFEVELDLTHPIAYGYQRRRLPVFRNSRIFLEPQSDAYSTVAAYSDSPLLSGYVSEENLGKLRGTPAVTAESHGGGAVVRMVDNPNFRAFWYGTNKLFANAILFGTTVE